MPTADLLAPLGRGLLVGVLVAAPVGPIGVLCLRRTLVDGRRAGLAAGLGAATADGTYALLAASGVAALTTLLEQLRTPLRVVAGAVLLVIAVRTVRPGARRGPRLATTDPAPALRRAYAQTLLLTLANPLTVLSFAAVVAGAGLVTGPVSGPGPVVLAGVAVGLGSALWWVVLVGVAGALRGRLTERGLRSVDVVAGLALGLFAVVVVLPVLLPAGG